MTRVRSGRTIVRALTPPAARFLGRRARDRLGRAELEVVPGGWPAAHDAARGGWNAPSIAETNRRKWPRFESAVAGTGPLGIAHEAPLISRESAAAHNTVLTFGYVLARAANGNRAVSLLDWGGGVGHYLVLGEALLPELEIDYHCKDVAVLCEVGRQLLPRAAFHDDDSYLDRRYDLVVASGSLQCGEDWQGPLARLARAARRFLFVTRLPLVHESRSFVMRQRPHRYGYETELFSWVLNRSEFLRTAEAAGLTPLREFIVNERLRVRGAGEAVHMRGFLFAPPSSLSAR